MKHVIAVGPDMRGHPSMHDNAEKMAKAAGCKFFYGQHEGLVGTVYYVEKPNGSNKS